MITDQLDAHPSGMSPNDARHCAVAALTELSSSPEWRDWADAGRALAIFADLSQASEPLHRLLLDPTDTFVTQATAEALARRNDAAGVAAIAYMLGSADIEQIEHIRDAVVTALGIFATDRDAAAQFADTLASSPEQTVRHGATHLHRILAQINPVLYPTSNDQS